MAKDLVLRQAQHLYLKDLHPEPVEGCLRMRYKLVGGFDLT